MKAFLTKVALVTALAVPGFIAAAPASAAPVALGAAVAGNAVETPTVQVYHRHWHRPGYYGRRHYRPVYGYRPRVVCRTEYRRTFRPGWGYVRAPVRVCYRR